MTSIAQCGDDNKVNEKKTTSLTTREASWYTSSVVSVYLSVCLSACHETITFESFDE